MKIIKLLAHEQDNHITTTTLTLPSVKWKIIYAKITYVQYVCTVCMNSMYVYVRRRRLRAERTNDRTQQQLLLLLLNDDDDDDDDDECGY